MRSSAPLSSRTVPVSTSLTKAVRACVSIGPTRLRAATGGSPCRPSRLSGRGFRRGKRPAEIGRGGQGGHGQRGGRGDRTKAAQSHSPSPSATLRAGLLRALSRADRRRSIADDRGLRYPLSTTLPSSRRASVSLATGPSLHPVQRRRRCSCRARSRYLPSAGDPRPHPLRVLRDSKRPGLDENPAGLRRPTAPGLLAGGWRQRLSRHAPRRSATAMPAGARRRLRPVPRIARSRRRRFGGCGGAAGTGPGGAARHAGRRVGVGDDLGRRQRGAPAVGGGHLHRLRRRRSGDPGRQRRRCLRRVGSARFRRASPPGRPGCSPPS